MPETRKPPNFLDFKLQNIILSNLSIHLQYPQNTYIFAPRIGYRSAALPSKCFSLLLCLSSFLNTKFRISIETKGRFDDEQLNEESNI